MSEDRAPGCLAPLPKRGPGALGMHAVPAHAHPRWLRYRFRGIGGRLKNFNERRKKMREEVEKALQTIRPALQADGGDVELVDVVDGIVKVRLKGACGGCPMSQMTLTRGVEQTIKRAVPEVKRVEAVE